MHIPRIYQAIELKPHSTITLSDKAYHHLIRVLRMRRGNPLTLFNGLGGEYPAELTQVDKRSATVSIQAFDPISRESSLHTHLYQAVIKGERMDWVIQKAVELGVSEITPLLCEHTTIKQQAAHLEKKYLHWQSIMINSAEQAGRTQLPVLNRPLAFNAAVQSLEGPGLIFHPSTHALNKLPIAVTDKINLVIGPEGGFSSSEVLHAKQKALGCCAIGPRILRAETATVTALTIAQSKFGDF